jgi:DNA repair protein RadA/Sms
MCLILAVLEKRLGLKFYQNDVYMNVIGGLSITEPAADLAIATALVSSLTDRVVPDDLIIIGELGLAGECRAVSNPEQRVREAARLGFTRAIVPFRNVEKRPLEVEGMRVIPVKSIFEVIRELKSIEG